MFNQASQFGNFVPTSNVWDLGQISNLKDESPELKELLVRLYQNLNLMSLSLNTRDAGYYDTQEFVNGQLYFPNPANTSTTPQKPQFRQVYRKVFNIPTPTGISFTIATQVNHGITVTSTTTFTRIYGVAQDTTNKIYRPLPYISTTGNNIALLVDATRITIAAQLADYPTINLVYVVLEYLQQ